MLEERSTSSVERPVSSVTNPSPSGEKKEESEKSEANIRYPIFKI
jgi:hypothetical protein